jgi:hypothetical protein
VIAVRGRVGLGDEDAGPAGARDDVVGDDRAPPPVPVDALLQGAVDPVPDDLDVVERDAGDDGVGADCAAEDAEAARGPEVTAADHDVLGRCVVEVADRRRAGLGDVDLDGLGELPGAGPGVVAVALEPAVDGAAAVGGVELEGVRGRHVADGGVPDRDVAAVHEIQDVCFGGDGTEAAVGGVAVPDSAEDLDVRVAGVAVERLGRGEVPQQTSARADGLERRPVRPHRGVVVHDQERGDTVGLAGRDDDEAAAGGVRCVERGLDDGAVVSGPVACGADHVKHALRGHVDRVRHEGGRERHGPRGAAVQPDLARSRAAAPLLLAAVKSPVPVEGVAGHERCIDDVGGGRHAPLQLPGQGAAGLLHGVGGRGRGLGRELARRLVPLHWRAVDVQVLVIDLRDVGDLEGSDGAGRARAGRVRGEAGDRGGAVLLEKRRDELARPGAPHEQGIAGDDVAGRRDEDIGGAAAEGVQGHVCSSQSIQ